MQVEGERLQAAVCELWGKAVKDVELTTTGGYEQLQTTAGSCGRLQDASDRLRKAFGGYRWLGKTGGGYTSLEADTGNCGRWLQETAADCDRHLPMGTDGNVYCRCCWWAGYKRLLETQ